jgi:hypothetical protein
MKILGKEREFSLKYRFRIVSEKMDGVGTGTKDPIRDRDD